MSANSNEPFSGLDRAFHEPKRLAIVSSLSARGAAVTFVDLKKECSLTDGNLNRHLKVLEEAGVVKLQKVEGRKGARPRTEVRLTRAGREHFVRYLDALEHALASAARAVGRPAGTEKEGFPAAGRRAPAG